MFHSDFKYQNCKKNDVSCKLALLAMVVLGFFSSVNYADETCQNLLLGCTQATFDTLPTITGTETSDGIALVDLDGDGKLDLAVSDFETGANAEKVAIYRGIGNGSFSSPIYVTAGSNPDFITSGDFNNDGKIDLAVATSQSGSTAVNNVAILINQSTSGNISLTGVACAINDPRCPAGGNVIQNIAVGRINNDSFLDLAVANNNDSVNSATLFYGTGNGNFSTPLTTIFSDRPWFVSLADIDGVNGLDLIAAIGDNDKIEIKYNDGNGNFPQSTFRDIPFTGDFPYSIVVADFDGNGKNDFATANSNSRDVSVYLQNNVGNFSAAGGSPYFILANRTPRFINIGDFNGDQRLDIVTANEGTSGGFAVLLGQSGGSFGSLSNFVTDTDNTKQVLVGDVTGDSRPDLILANSAANDKIFVRKNTCLSVINRPKFDFDGDGRSDISVYRPSNGVWYLLNSQSGFTATQFGISTDRLAPADFDGDGRTDIAVYRNGTWFIQRSTLGFTAIQFGITEDIPQPADFDGDGRAEVAVFRPSNGIWYVINLVNNQFTGFQFGSLEDKPVVGDYDGDNRADYAVFRPSNGIWYYQQSTAGFGAIQFGLNTDKPVPADYDGDGRTDVAVFRPSNGIWYYQRSTAGFGAIQFGLDTDRPSPADYDGDGRADVAVFRPSNGIWYLQQSTAGFTAIQFGIAEDKPIPNAFVP